MRAPEDIDPVTELFLLQRAAFRTHGDEMSDVTVPFDVVRAAVNELLEARMRTGSALQLFSIGAMAGAVSGAIIMYLWMALT